MVGAILPSSDGLQGRFVEASCSSGSKTGLNSSTFARHAPLLGNMAPLNEEHFPAIQALNGKSGCKFNYRDLFLILKYLAANERLSL